MDTFCMIAFIPSIILAIWLLVEIRKYVITSKRLNQIESRWRTTKNDDEYWGYDTEDEFVDSIPAPRSTYDRGFGSRRRRVPSRKMRKYEDYDHEHNNYDFNYIAEPDRPNRYKRSYQEYNFNTGSDYDYSYTRSRDRAGQRYYEDKYSKSRKRKKGHRKQKHKKKNRNRPTKTKKSSETKKDEKAKHDRNGTSEPDIDWD